MRHAEADRQRAVRLGARLAQADALLGRACGEIGRAAAACIAGKFDAEARVKVALGTVAAARVELLRLVDEAEADASRPVKVTVGP